MPELQDQNNYKESLKATSLFGGVQIFNIIIGVIRSKFVAVLLGPAGMGISGLLSSATGLISSFTNCGLGTSAVRNISEANNTSDSKRVALVITVFRKLVWMTGLFGATICLIFSSFWSKITFGNTDYTYAFIILSLTILLLQLTSAQNALLQGLRKYKYLATANVIGSTIGLFITVPLYYFWGIDAIVPVLLLSNVITFILAYYFVQKVKIEKIPVALSEVKKEGTGMMKMGFFISLQGMLSLLSAYLVRIYISNFGGLEDVGFYNAGFTIINTYVGLVFTAMGTDYYPRLSAIAADNVALNKMINQQAEISILLVAPIIAVFIIYIKWVIRLLYSSKFLDIEGMIYWAIFAIFLKAISWSISFSFLAKGDTKTFFWNEFTTIIYATGLNIFGYFFWGLTGLGISFLIIYFLYLFQVWIVCGKKYGIILQLPVFKIFSIQFALSVFCILLKLFSNNLIAYIAGTVLIAFSTYYSFLELNKRVAIKQIMLNKIHRK